MTFFKALLWFSCTATLRLVCLRSAGAVSRCAKLLSDDSKQLFVPFTQSQTELKHEEDIIEVYDLPIQDHFIENPQFDYVGQLEEEKVYPFINNSRGLSGVFEISEIVKFLKVENFSGVVCLQLPESSRLGSHMVIATAKSKRHLSQTAHILQRLFKMKRNSSDKIPNFEGLNQNSDWIAVDLGNIILHLFSSTCTREAYNLESLWGAGPQFDEQTQGLHKFVIHTGPVSENIFHELNWEKIIKQASEERDKRKEHTKQPV